MSDSQLYTLYLAGAFLLLFTSAELLYHKFNVNAELTRKYVHVVTGLLTMLFPTLIGNTWLVLALCGSFLVILLSSMALNLLPSINAVARKTCGSILYPIVVSGCYLIYEEYDQFMLYYVPILILALCDPVANIVGRKWPLGEFRTFGKSKTLGGSVSFFVTAIITTLFLTIGLEVYPLRDVLVISVSVALATAFAEAFTHKGYDNLTIPVSALAVLLLLRDYYSL
jgi:phytol kinase